MSLSLLVLLLSVPPEVLKEAPKSQRQVNGNGLRSASQLSYWTYGRTQGNVDILTDEQTKIYSKVVASHQNDKQDLIPNMINIFVGKLLFA